MNQAKPKTDAGKNLKDLKQKSEKNLNVIKNLNNCDQLQNEW